jgi:isoleucyl-tRNA synthetase
LDLKRSYLAREITNRIQKSRKEAGVHIEDKISIIVSVPEESQDLKDSLINQIENIQNLVKKPIVLNSNCVYSSVGKFDYEIKDEKITVEVVKCAIEILTKPEDKDSKVI